MLVDMLRSAFAPRIPMTRALWIDVLGLALYAALGLAVPRAFSVRSHACRAAIAAASLAGAHVAGTISASQRGS
ncbi:MAG TPA: hypothetical protein VFO07_05450 [Roseiflexaceae bacterium]|nr:hypothetical protein [Roseiflexaceae bacterium]